MYWTGLDGVLDEFGPDGHFDPNHLFDLTRFKYWRGQFEMTQFGPLGLRRSTWSYRTQASTTSSTKPIRLHKGQQAITTSSNVRSVPCGVGMQSLHTRTFNQNIGCRLFRFLLRGRGSATRVSRENSVNRYSRQSHEWRLGHSG